MDKLGNTIDFYLSSTRNTKAAKRFLGKTLKAAYATIKGFEVMRALRKGQAGIFALQGGVVGEVRIVERAFDLGPCALTEAMALLRDRLANAES